MQAGAIEQGQKVIVVDDLIATGALTSIYVRLSREADVQIGGSAGAAGQLVEKQGGRLLEFLFIIEITFLKGAEKLSAPTYSIVKVDE